MTNAPQFIAMGFSTCVQEVPLEHDRSVVKSRRLAAQLLAQIVVHYNQQQSQEFLNYLTQNLNYRSGIHRMFVGMMATEWAKVSHLAFYN